MAAKKAVDVTAPKSFTVNMTFHKSTKGTHVYNDDADEPMIPTLYIRRSALGDEPAKAITVLVTEVNSTE